MVSEEVKAFLDFVEESKKVYDIALGNMKAEERRLQDFLHAIEFETRAKERNKICTKLHQSRKTRRQNKNIVEAYEPVVRFFQEPQHKKTLDRMTQLLGELRRVEKYHKERQYHPRMKD